MDAHTPNTTSLAKTPLNLFKEIYKVERELRVRLRKKRITPDQFASLRRKRTKVYWKTFREWLKDTAPLVPPGTALGKAVHYARNHYTRVIRYLKYPEVTPYNNIAENAIRISGVPQGEARGTLATPFRDRAEELAVLQHPPGGLCQCGDVQPYRDGEGERS